MVRGETNADCESVLVGRMTKITKKQWTKVRDTRIRSTWRCPECGVTCHVDPSWYEQNGTPMCWGCDCDMAYGYTEVLQ